MIINQYL